MGWEEEAFWFLPFLEVMLKTCWKAASYLQLPQVTSPTSLSCRSRWYWKELSVPHPAFWTFHPSPLFYKRGRLVWELPKTIVCTMSLVWQRNCDRRYSVQNYLAVSCCSVAVREWTFLREEKKIGIPSSSFEHYRLRTPKTSVNTNIYPYNFKSWLQAWFNLQDFLKSGIGSRLSLGLAAGQVDVFSGYRCMQGCSKAAT